MENPGAYHPIACDFHDQLEAYATLRRKVKIALASGGDAEGIIRDFRTTAEKEEFLLLQDGSSIRLDRIKAVTPLD